MANRLSPQEKIHAVLQYAKFENFHEVVRQWKNQFTTQPPHERTIRILVKKFKETGSIHDRERTGRLRTVVTEETVEEVRKKLEDSANLSIRKGAIQMEMTVSSYYRAIEEAGFRSFKPTTVQELSDDDFDRRKEFCEIMLKKIEENPKFLRKILWSDKSEFKLNGTVNRHNCCYWAQSNPHEIIPVSNSKQGVMVWCGMNSSGLIGPYFFDGSVTSESYLQMLDDFLWPLVKQQRMFFQQDGAPAHYSLDVRNWLNKKFGDRWIGRRGPIEWPARSPDLTPPDFFLWGYLKNIVYRSEPSTCDELRSRIEEACAEISKDMCKRVCQNVEKRLRLCLETEGLPVT